MKKVTVGIALTVLAAMAGLTPAAAQEAEAAAEPSTTAPQLSAQSTARDGIPTSAAHTTCSDSSRAALDNRAWRALASDTTSVHSRNNTIPLDIPLIRALAHHPTLLEKPWRRP